jgi:peptidoglycan/xylan/chitin deacetylase (PgdA/CDA1 family)
MNQQFFARTDGPTAGLPRELVGYGDNPPQFEWQGKAKVAVQIVVNYEEGSEKTFPMGDGENDVLHEIPFKLEGTRDMAVESVYEYGSRAGIWRLFRIFEAAAVPITVFGAAVALERNPAVAEKIRERGDEAAAHGYRWSNGYEMTADEEREAIRLAVESITQTTGSRPLGWYSREMSVNTRELVVEEGGFVYDSESYNDDIPYWTSVYGKAHLVVPYSLVVNDCRFVLPQGYSNPNDLFDFAKASLDRLRNDGDDNARMMSVGLHPRFSGNPARADALARFIEYAQGHDDVWFARRIDIARDFMERVPAEGALVAS